MKSELIKQSINLFVEKGFSATSIQDIVDTIGVTKGSFYYHFKSKEALLMDIHSHYIDDLLRRQRAILDTEKSHKDKLMAIVELIIVDIEKQGAVGRVYFREIRHLKEENAAIIREKRADFRNNIEVLLKEGIEANEFRKELQPKIITFAILGITNWSYQWFNVEGSLTVKELSAMYTDFILHGIQSPDASN
ncbi:TetR/AcrR family transcriptional regulator [Microbacterium sp. APC 3898]|uniref:TetR/AcrR family transcriptional regulator n=1 Tax=Planococcus notacanthi TaxID=3035188 RepID=A0ABT7ZLJ1_9BACL|nr:MULTISPECIES: TetR/AcrR family transcriptional regulator [Terrabacteria group]MDN3428040.1 TetR/AcrR family transcriptional regulator [Planococcus sp. APC 4016]MDN3439017.1 TetR/AcrR family transcriptional regulator [Planococcus sp. APC 3900]MDN3498425.1 TetR/AcrR family transcriptional regulator [Microbacterium sp. APC 3898]